MLVAIYCGIDNIIFGVEVFTSIKKYIKFERPGCKNKHNKINRRQIIFYVVWPERWIAYAHYFVITLVLKDYWVNGKLKILLSVFKPISDDFFSFI